MSTATALRLTCSAKTFRAAYDLVARIPSKNSPAPVMKSVRLEIPESGPPMLSATNGEYSVIAEASGVSESSPGVVMLSPKVGEILREVGDVTLDIVADGDILRISTPSDEWKLPTQDPSTFPEIDGFPEGPTIRVLAPALAAAVRRASAAADGEASKYALGGCLFAKGADGSTLRVVGTEGHMLSAEDIAAGTESWHTSRPAVPVKPLAWLVAALGDDEGEVDIAFPDEYRAFFRLRGIVLVARLCEGAFPRYEDSIPTESVATATAPCGALRDAIARAALCRSEESNGLRFDLGGPEIVLRAQGADVGSSVVRLPAECTGRGVTFAVNPDFLPFLKLFPEDAEMRLCFDGARIVSFRSGDNFQHHVSIIVKD